MNKITRWYNQKCKMIWIVVLTIGAVIALIQTLNNYYKNNTKDESSSTNISTTTNATNNYSVVTQEKINETVSDESIDLIKDFFYYCNNGKIENAYNLLSEECKQELYPTVDDFKAKYYNKIFTEQKSYDSMLWITTSRSHTYRVEIMADLLATGQKDNMPIEDYYTIIYENGDYKLSINNYIGKEDLNISKTLNEITVTIVSKQIYVDYEKYEISVKNSTNTNLIFNTKENTNSIYIEDENNVKYIAFLNEISAYELNVLNGLTKTFNIRFNRGYKPKINIKKIVFEDIKIQNNEETKIIEIEM